MRVIVLLRRVILSRSLCRRLKILLDVNGILMIRFCTPCFASTYSKMSLNTQVDQALALDTICKQKILSSLYKTTVCWLLAYPLHAQYHQKIYAQAVKDSQLRFGYYQLRRRNSGIRWNKIIISYGSVIYDSCTRARHFR